MKTEKKKTSVDVEDVEIEKEVEKDLAKKSRSPIVIGGLALVFVGAIIVSQLCCSDKNKTEQEVVADDSAVVAVINGENVHMSELEKIKNAIAPWKEEPMAVVYNKLLEAYVNNKVILAAARKADIQNRADIKKLLSDTEDQILFQAYLSEQLQARMTPDRLKEIYAKEIANYVPQDEIHARHILVATEKEAKDLIVKLKGGADFSTLANKYSLDKNANADNAGDLGYFTKDMMIPDFANAAFAIKVGQISEKPVKTAFGWHVIKIEDKRKAAPPSMAEMTDVLKARFSEETIPLILEAERAKANVQLLDPLGVNKMEQLTVDVAPAKDAETAETVTVEENETTSSEETE